MESAPRRTAEHPTGIEWENQAERLAREHRAQEAARERNRRQLAWERARQTRTGLFIYLAISTEAIKQAAGSEPDPLVRRFRQNMLVRRWQQLSGDLLRTPSPSPW